MATIPANNNTGLYNTSPTAGTTGNDITVNGNVNANNINAVNTVNAGTDVNAVGNIVAGGYFVGDGSYLTNIPAGNIVGGYGNANVAAYLASGSNSSNIVTTGNISGTYILGDGSLLTGLPATYSNSNVTTLLAAFGSNTIVTTGNITGGYFVGNGSQLTGIASSYGNADVAAYLPTFTGNLAGGNATITNDLTVGGIIYGTFSGNITGNIVVPGSNTEVLFNNNGNAGASADFTFNDATKLLTVAGNVNATAFNGSGAGLTSIPGANVTGTVPLATAATTAGTVTTAAQPNITSVGTLTSLTTSGNVDVGGSLNTDDVTSTGNVTIYGNQVITGNLTVQGTTTTINSNTITTNDKTITVANNQSTGANVNGAGLEAGNPAVATFLYDDATTTWKSSIGLAAVGNITGSYIFGNGSQLTGLPATYGNANVANFLSNYGSNNISTTGSISADTLTSNSALVVKNSLFPSYVTISSGIGTGNWDMLLPLTAGSSGQFLQTNGGGALTWADPTGTYGNANVAAYLPTYTGNLTGGNAAITGNITTGGILTDGYYYANGTPVTFGGGSTYGDSNVAAFLTAFGSNSISTTGNVTAGYFVGNGSALTSITGANITGTVANATYATSAGTATSATDATHATIADTANAVAGANVTGTVANATYATSAGTASTSTSAGVASYVTANAQANITSVGTLTSLAVTGNVSGGNLAITGGITAGANISGNYILGNGSQLTGIVSSYGNTNVAAYLASGTNSSNIITTGNVTGTYITTTGAAGNITGANYVTANYFVGDGSLLTNIATTYGNTNVTSLLSSFGSNTIVTTGNITGGYFIGNGSALTGITATANLAGNLTGNINTGSYYITSPGAEVLMGNVWVTGTLAANTISAPAGDYVTIEGVASTNGLNSSGNINALDQKSVNFFESGSTNYVGLKAPASVAADLVWTLPGTDGTSGQALSTYGNGVMYWATGGGGGGSPGGSDTQIQFNDGGSFAGNAAMTFSKTTGNITLGTTVVNGQQILTTAAANVGLTTSLTPNPGRVVVGTGYNGNTSPAYDQANNGRGARLLVTDSIGFTDANSGYRGLGVQNFYTLNNNISGSNIRLAGVTSSIQVGGGASANTLNGGSVFSASSGAFSLNIGGGTSGNLTGLGNTIVQYAVGLGSATAINAGSTGGNIFSSLNFWTNSGTANTVIGHGIVLGGAGTFSGNVYGVYMPGGTNNHGITNSNNARNASNYHFLRNEDNHSKSQLGQLTQYQETQYALSSSGGAVDVSKSNGQVQLFSVSEDATMSFSNFVVSSTVGATTRYMTDTVTVIVQQDGTGRTITMPSGSAYKYAGGANSVPTTADSVSMISITAYYDTVAAGTAYLITISPEFS